MAQLVAKRVQQLEPVITDVAQQIWASVRAVKSHRS